MTSAAVQLWCGAVWQVHTYAGIATGSVHPSGPMPGIRRDLRRCFRSTCVLCVFTFDENTRGSCAISHARIEEVKMRSGTQRYVS